MTIIWFFLLSAYCIPSTLLSAVVLLPLASVSHCQVTSEDSGADRYVCLTNPVTNERPSGVKERVLVRG